MVKITPRIAVFGGSGYLASLLKIRKIIKNLNLLFIQEKTEKNYINYLSLKKNQKYLINLIILFI